jgi:hypothetical protein
MSGMVIFGDDAILLSLPGSSLGGIAWDVYPLVESPTFHVHATIVVTAAPPTYAVFKLPDLYNYYPEIVRWMDTTYVPRDEIPLYYWDSTPRWDAEPFTWDEVLGPEPVLKTTTRIMQLELEKSAQEIADLLKMYNLETCPEEVLPYHAAMLGTPLPAAAPALQRAFLENLGETYRNKGTPLSFYRLFESLGFTLLLEEFYHRRSDAFLVDGPQIDLTSTNYVPEEAAGVTPATAGTIVFQLSNAPVCRGSIVLSIYDVSTNVPTIIKDDGDGQWTRGYAGSIDYRTGSCVLTFLSAPTLSGQPVTASYYYLPDAFPDPHGVLWTDRRRSSVVYVGLIPKDPTVNLTTELTSRLLLYLNLLKPAHIIVRSLEVIFESTDSEFINLDDDLDLYAYLHAESLFGTLYLGLGWSGTDNASLNPAALYTGFQGRIGNEWMSDWSGPGNPAATLGGPAGVAPLSVATYSDTPPDSPDVGDLWVDTSSAPGVYLLKLCQSALPLVWATVQTMQCDPTRYPSIPPYTYPFRMNGLFFQPTTGGPAPGTPPLPGPNDNEAYWFDYDPATSARFDSTVSSDIANTDTQFSIVLGAGTTLGVGDRIVAVSGPAGGEASLITAFVGMGTYYDVTVSPALPIAPDVGDDVTVLILGGVGLKNTTLRPQETLDLYFIESLYSLTRAPAPTPLTVSYTGQLAAKLPISTTSVTVGFTIAAVDYIETDDGAGNISNVNGFLHATVPSTINYATGELVLEFSAVGPDAVTDITITYTSTTSVDLGAY